MHPIKLLFLTFVLMATRPTAVEVMKIIMPNIPENKKTIRTKKSRTNNESFGYGIFETYFENFFEIETARIEDKMLTAIIIIKIITNSLWLNFISSLTAEAAPVRALFMA